MENGIHGVYGSKKVKQQYILGKTILYTETTNISSYPPLYSHTIAYLTITPESMVYHPKTTQNHHI